MTAKATLSIPQTGRNSGLFDWAQMLSGVFLILFMWAHLLLVASVLISTNIMNAIAYFFEATYLVQIGGPLIGMLMIFHFIIAARKMPFSGRELLTFWRHARMMKHKDTWLWLVQVLSALIVLVLATIHMWFVLTDLPITAAKSAVRVKNLLPFYAVLLPMIELHVAIGFYRIGVKWGFVGKKGRKWFQRFEVLMSLGFITIGALTLAQLYYLAGKI